MSGPKKSVPTSGVRGWSTTTGRPEGLTLEQFKHVMRTGFDPVDKMTLSVMPWPIYRNMTDRDLEAIYSFLSAIPPAEPGDCGGAGE